MDERPRDEEQPDQQQPETWPYEPETAPEPPTEAPVSATVPWWRQPGPAILAGAVIIAAGVGVGIAVAGSGRSAPPVVATTPTPSVSAVLLNGTLTIPFTGSDLLNPNAKDTEQTGDNGPDIGDTCVALGGYSDISAGTAITVGGDKGQTLAVGSLDAGSVSGQAGQPASCEFAFSVDVPEGQSLYTVTISHRGTQTFTPAQVADGIALTLGQ